LTRAGLYGTSIDARHGRVRPDPVAEPLDQGRRDLLDATFQREEHRSGVGSSRVTTSRLRTADQASLVRLPAFELRERGAQAHPVDFAGMEATEQRGHGVIRGLVTESPAKQRPPRLVFLPDALAPHQVLR